MNISSQLIEEFGFKPSQVENTLGLFDEGATVPFIARYRKERTGGLDEIQIRDLLHKYTYYKELDERRETILESIKSQGKLTPELAKKINETLSKTELEDLYLPYKPKRQTRGTKAKDAGLEPLSEWLFNLSEAGVDIEGKAQEFLNPEKGIDTVEKAIQGACDILAENFSDDAEVRKHLRELAFDDGEIISVARKDFVDKKTKFSMYYDYREKVSTVVSHRTLAMFRGEREKVLRLELRMPRDEGVAWMEQRFIQHSGSASEALLKKTVADSFDRLLLLATETEIRKQIRGDAEEEAFKVFGENLKELLMAPPAGQKPAMGIDPGFRSGCKVVALDKTGKLLEYQAVFPNEPQNKKDEAAAIVKAMIQRHGVELIAIGNGTASRETDAFVRETIKDIPEDKRPVCVIVSEAGASVYSASETAAKEFPEYDLTVRGAVSIARRLQDPLSELVKIDPKSIGVGQYQHDVNQPKLKSSLEEVVESCVNKVGVDLNLASEELLKYVSGLNRTHAARIVEYRNEKGAYSSRKDLMSVSGVGAKCFEQAAGFLRIPGAANPLDNSSVHPERYEFVEKMASELKASIEQLIGNTQALRSIDKRQFVTDDIGLPTIDDIIAELDKPGRDPRAEFTYAVFDDKIQEISDLAPDMVLEGTVTNVANFGAFV
ncbi:MAG: RNA-binding transcriptional accessory protein, partial [Chitinivibrionales bacterium]|nr:RNA-binding transcriptional accessory protein [Chitinivibrionales bacterium]